MAVQPLAQQERVVKRRFGQLATVLQHSVPKFRGCTRQLVLREHRAQHRILGRHGQQHVVPLAAAQREQLSGKRRNGRQQCI